MLIKKRQQLKIQLAYNRMTIKTKLQIIHAKREFRRIKNRKLKFFALNHCLRLFTYKSNLATESFQNFLVRAKYFTPLWTKRVVFAFLWTQQSHKFTSKQFNNKVRPKLFCTLVILFNGVRTTDKHSTILSY